MQSVRKMQNVNTLNLQWNVRCTWCGVVVREKLWLQTRAALLIGSHEEVFRFRGGICVSRLKCGANSKAGKRTAVVLPCSNSEPLLSVCERESCRCSWTQTPGQLWKEETKWKSASSTSITTTEESFLKEVKVESRKEKRKKNSSNFYLSTSLCGWGMGSNTTAAAAAEQKPHELPNGWMKKLPAATAK